MKIRSDSVITVHTLVLITVLAGMTFELARGHFFTAVQCLLTLFLCAVPSVLDRKFDYKFPCVLEILAILFIFGSTYLGEIRGFYTQIPVWDTILHTIFGFIAASVGFSFIRFYGKKNTPESLFTPFFEAFFSFCFSMTSGVVWEFFEFGMDRLFSTDMQKDWFVEKITSVLIDKDHLPVESASLNGESLPGLLDIGLTDTMKDLFTNAAGAIVFAVFAVIYLNNSCSDWVLNFIPGFRAGSEIKDDLM